MQIRASAEEEPALRCPTVVMLRRSDYRLDLGRSPTTRSPPRDHFSVNNYVTSRNIDAADDKESESPSRSEARRKGAITLLDFVALTSFAAPKTDGNPREAAETVIKSESLDTRNCVTARSLRRWEKEGKKLALPHTDRIRHTQIFSFSSIRLSS